MDAGNARPFGRGVRWAAWTLTVAAALSWAGVARASERVALVIGNGAYEHVSFLENPRNDARDIGAALGRLGFEVSHLANAGQAQLRQGLRDFTRAASASEVAVVFYAGRGIEVDGRNFLVPVDAQLQSDRDVEFETVPLDLVLRSVERAHGLRLVILDACRDNPFAKSMQRAGATRSIGRGLARKEPAGETLLAYAAKSGSVASDDGDGRNSPYTGALLRYLEEPGLDVGDMFRKVRDEVLRTTGGVQEPFTYGSLPGRDVYLASGPGPIVGGGTTTPPPPPPPPSLDPARAYEATERVGTVAAFQAFIKRYPHSYGATLAKEQIAKLEHENPDIDPAEVEKGLGLSREERRLVQRALASAGYDPGPLDGMIGGGTRGAIRRWQGARGEVETGYLNAGMAKELLASGKELARGEEARFSELLGRPFSPEWKEESVDWTDLHYAALLDLPGVVAALCDAGMDADERLKTGSPPFGDDLKRTLATLGHEESKDWKADGETPLMIASYVNARNAAAALVDCDANVDEKNTTNGQTPMHYASWKNSLAAAELLIERGADVNKIMDNGWTPIDVTLFHGNLKLQALLRRHSGKCAKQWGVSEIPCLGCLGRVCSVR